MRDFAGNERYEIVSEIGAGGMGTVYKAFDSEAQTQVALKVLRSYSPEALLRFKREFRSLAGLEHPNLILLGELAEADGSWFFTMELIDGDDFLEYVSLSDGESPGDAPANGNGAGNGGRENGHNGLRCDEQLLRAVLVQVVRGLAALHRANKVHCDIKPSNVLVDRSGRAVVLDFGLVADTGRPDPLSGPHAAGTITYMAPEQLEHRDATAAADFYAVGTMMFEAMTGELPFDGTLAELVVKKHQSSARQPSELVSGIPSDLDRLCIDLLSRQPQDRPMAGEILRRLGAATDGSVNPISERETVSGASSVFVGRNVELEALMAALEPENRPTTVALRAASGVGKTAVARRFVEMAKRRTDPEVLILEGRCFERENVPFKGADGMVDALARHLLTLPDDQVEELLPDSAALLVFPFPALRRVNALRVAEVWQSANVQDQRERVFVALRGLFARLAEKQPVVVLIDDMQWAGADTWMLFRHLMKPPSPPELLLVLLARPPEELPDTPDPFQDFPGRLDIFDLEQLSPDEAVELARELLREYRGSNSSHGAAPASATEATTEATTEAATEATAEVLTTISDQLARESGGHPLFIQELVHHVSESGSDTTRQNRLEDALIARIGRLPPESRSLVEFVAIAGVPVEQSVVARAAEVDFTEYSRAVAPLSRNRLVHTLGFHPSDLIEPYHDRVRQSVLGCLSADRRCDLHDRLALALEEAGVFEHSPELAVYHLSAAGHDQRAAGFAELAGERASAALAFDQAANLFDTALELGDHDVDATLRLTMARAEALVACGRNAVAAELFARAGELARDPDTRLECDRRAAEQLLFSGRLAEGVQALERVLAQIGERLAPTTRRAMVSLLWQRARLRLRGLDATERPESELLADDLRRLAVYRTVTLGLGLVDNIRAADFQSRHLRLALALGEPSRLVPALSMETFFLASQMAARSRLLADATDHWAERDGAPLSRAFALFARIGVHYFMDNDWAAALECLIEGERLLREHTQSAGFETDTIRVFRCFCYMQQGDLTRLSRWVPAYIEEAERRGDRYVQVSLRSRLILPWLVAGDPDAAQTELDQAFTNWVPWTETYSVQHFYGLHSQCEVALYRGQPEIAQTAVAEQMEALRRSFLLRIPLVRAEIDYARARLAIASGPDHLAEARSIARSMAKNPAPAAAGLHSLVCAGIARLQGNDDDALDYLDQAIAALDRLDQGLISNAARWHRGDAVGGDEGASQRAEAAAWLDERGVVDPEALCRMLIPGWS